VAWSRRFAGSSVIARWLPPGFNNSLDPDSIDCATNLVYGFPNLQVEYSRAEPPGIPTAFWRSVGPSHTVFVVESFVDELAAAAKQDPVAYRRALLDRDQRERRQGRAVQFRHLSDVAQVLTLYISQLKEAPVIN
jgi:isoquinoline 1-oxidoreductase beta subunit